MNGQYWDDAVDMTLKIPGDLYQVKRQYYDNMWHFSDTQWNLTFIYGVGGTAPTSIVKSGISYQAADSPGTVFTNLNRTIFAKPGGYLWQDTAGNWKSYDLAGKVLAYGNRNLTLGIYVYAGNVLTAINDGSGNQVVSFQRDATGNITAAVDGFGDKVQYSYTNNVLTQVIDLLGNSTYYTYDTGGRITQKQDAEGRITNITYNNFGYASAVTSPDGFSIQFNYSYDAGSQQYYSMATFASGRIRETWFDNNYRRIRTDLNGRTIEKITYDNNNKIFTDENGNQTYQYYDEFLNLTKEVWPDGSFFTNQYDPALNVVLQHVDELGIVTAYQYDANGNATQKVEAVGTPSARTTQFTYDATGNMLTSSVLADAVTAAATTIMTYDALGNATSVTDPEGNPTSFIYNQVGQVLTKTDPRGNIWSYEYDVLGRLTKQKDPLRDTTLSYYDNVGNVVKVVDAEGNATTQVYDNENRVISSTDALGGITRFTYDTDGNLTQAVDPEQKTLTKQYDLDGRLTRVIDGDGNQISYQYNNGGGGGSLCSSCAAASGTQPSTVTTPALTKQFAYDARGRKVQETDVLNNGDLNTAFFSYDLAGNLITRTDKAGNAISFVYDELSRKVKATDSLGNVTQYAYDNRDNMIAVTDANGSTTLFQYDRANRKVKETRPQRQQTAYQYDASGNLVTRTDPLGQVTAYAYDAAGRQTSISYSSTVSVPASTVTFAYNNVGKLLTWGDGTASGQFEYDQNYRKTSETVNFGNVGGLNPYQLSYSYAYYRSGTKKSFTGPSGDIYQYNYDQANLLSGVTLPDSSTITYNAYSWVVPSRITLPGGTTRTYAYNEFMYPTNIQALDPGQNVIMNHNYTHDKVNNVLTNQTEYGPYNYTYDNTYRLTRAQKPDLSNEQFGYDPVGNRTSSGADNLPYTYDANDQLLTIGSDTETWDSNGNMASRTIGGITTNFFYDAENRLVSVGTSDGTVVAQYYYDPFGHRLWKNAGGVTTYFMYADEGLIGEYNASGQEIASYGYKPNSTWIGDPLFMKQGGQYYFYQNDALGTPKMITSTAGAVVWSAVYDAFGQEQVLVSIINNNLRLPGQYYDAETGLHYNLQRHYDPVVGRFISEDPLGFNGGDVNLYAYTGNNPINRIDPLGLYDLLDFGGDALNFAAGLGNASTFGASTWIVQQGFLVTGNPDNAAILSRTKRCSGVFKAGEWAGMVLSMAFGGAVGAQAAEANAGRAGFEFSHWIPVRMGGPRSIFNGNFVSQKFHYLTDFYRYPTGWLDWGSKLPPALQQVLRIPWVYDGAAAGAAYGGASAMARRSCECQ